MLFATDGQLQVLTTDGSVVKAYALASDARMLAAPVIHEGVVYVVQEDATLNIIDDVGVSGYGSAIWPRYRKDNVGSAAFFPSAPDTTPTPTVTPTPVGTPTTPHRQYIPIIAR